MGKGALRIARGTLFAQVVALVSLPVITRLFTPSDFGTFALYTSVLSIALIFASLKYELAIPLPEKDEDAVSVTILACALVLFISAIFMMVFLTCGEMLLQILQLSPLQSYTGILIVSFFCAGLYQVLNFWAIRIKAYQLIGSTLIRKSCAGSAGKIFFGLLQWGVPGLILGDLLSQMSGLVSVSVAFWKNSADAVKKTTLHDTVRIARRYFRFPLFSLPSVFFNTLAFQLPVILLFSFYGSVTAGSYSLAMSVFAVPVGLVSISISQVFLGEIAGVLRTDPGKIRSLYHTTLIRIATITVPLIAALGLAAPVVFPVIFGIAWKDAGYFCTALCLMVVLQTCVSSVSILHYSGFNSAVLFFDGVRTGVVAGIFAGAHLLNLSALDAIILYSAAMGFMYVVNYAINLKAISYLESSSLKTE